MLPVSENHMILGLLVLTHYQRVTDGQTERDRQAGHLWLKPGFHYPSSRPEYTARVDGCAVSITREHGPC